tara:strand:- start:16346 stop:17239 length:894 start_codon:yes stop_codon:yes gene_type:complete
MTTLNSSFGDTYTHYVWVDLSARSPFTDKADTATMRNFETNRIGLKCDSVSISTAKNIMSFPTPAIGIATGESVSLGLDLGMSTKSITLSGIITEQRIQKQFTEGDLPKSVTDHSSGSSVVVTDSDGSHTSVVMTAQEVAQLMHSYVDASFMQSHQNLNKLIILIPSRVGPDWIYHTKGADGTIIQDSQSPYSTDIQKKTVDGVVTGIGGIGGGTTLETCPLIPFNYAVRGGTGGYANSKLDSKNSMPMTSFPKPIDASTNITEGISGFVRSFDTTLIGGQPYVEFNMQFEIAFASL